MYVLTELKQENERHDNFKKMNVNATTKNKHIPKLNLWTSENGCISFPKERLRAIEI